MPVGKIAATKRGKAAVAAAVVFAAVSGWTAFTSARLTPAQPNMTPAIVQAAVDKGLTPPAVRLAVDYLTKDWEGVSLVAYLDKIAKPPVWTFCYGETKGVTAGMRDTLAGCKERLERRMTHDYYLPMVWSVKNFVQAPDSVQAAMIDGAYNFGLSAAKNSTAAKRISESRYREACAALTAFNKAGGKIINGLVKRREMGDAQRIGEAELCLSGL
ncbi:lysozyme [Mesorhizobium sp. BR1-1-16]|uniref:lysozyme n=1 Tax=Mesorhizobium sp. BR1-1-16 TaxID=2876653 RepID=UPI001CCC492D|nr:lysozyme [Mesorhizobium sp. BR1-1-16]MBZ9939118.1 lysozyme [Mesorhizobium sp. BR1-1-16]